MNNTRETLSADLKRLQAKGLYGPANDSLSVRIPGRDEFLLAAAGQDEYRTRPFDALEEETTAFHAALYRARPDAGAILIGTTPWSTSLSDLDGAIPILFDEQARHIGKTRAPVRDASIAGLLNAVANGANVAIVAGQRVCIGTTPDRVVFNAELFEKCAKAYVLAQCSGQRIRRIPGWVCHIAGSRMLKDQKRSAESYAAGQIPEGMNAY